MGAKFSKTTTTKGMIKNILIQERNFVDEETGEIVDLIDLLNPIYGCRPFDISTSAKDEEEL